MAALLGLLYALLYKLRRYKFGGAGLDVWLSAVLAGYAGLAWLGWLPGGRGTALAIVALIALLILGGQAAKRSQYLHFVIASALGADAPAPLWPEDKLLLRASGVFSVDGSEKTFTDLPAYYRTFETREHAVMARRTPSRFGLLGTWPEDELGMWYIFTEPNALNAVEPGWLYHGLRPAPGLRVDATRLNAKGKPMAERFYLAFHNEADRNRVLADLTLDLGGPPRRPWRAPTT